MLNRWIEQGLTGVLDEEGIGCIVFSPLAQGQLTSRYLRDIPADSRAAREGFLKTDQVRNNLPKIQALNKIAQRRGQSLAQMAIAWVLRLPVVTSALLGAKTTRNFKIRAEFYELGLATDGTRIKHGWMAEHGEEPHALSAARRGVACFPTSVSNGLSTGE